MRCPVCDAAFMASGRRRYCSGACRVAAHRRRHRAEMVIDPLPPGPRGRDTTVYECAACGHRALGEQRCEDCSTFMSRIGIGGLCPCCDEPVSVDELLVR